MTQTALRIRLKLKQGLCGDIECGRSGGHRFTFCGKIGEHLGSEASAFIPQHREYLEDSTGVHLDADTVSQIEGCRERRIPPQTAKLTEIHQECEDHKRRGNDGQFS